MAGKELVARREHLLGAGAPMFYDEPLHIVRGEGVWLFDEHGRRFLDCYNNVPHVGHCNPNVVAALSRQAGTLAVHNRYLHEEILRYGERLTATLDPSLSKILFTCTGSEANDQALRMARGATGGMGIICTNLTYHGNTTAVDEISPLFYANAAPHPNVRTIPYPDSYRPPDGLEGTALTDVYVAKISAAIDDFNAAGIGFAGMIVCPIFANEGLPTIPPEFLSRAIATVHAAGGLFIADEVQAGLGRCGRMWGHELGAITPDIVTMGKPMGNGYPLAALATTPALMDEFRARVMYFNTFAGNPVAGAVGNAVLDVLARDKLIAHAQEIGDAIRAGIRRLAAKYDLIGDVRGHGLWIGVELVEDRVSKAPATALTRTIVNRMKDRGILLNRIGEFDNVLKMRPPLPFDHDHAEHLLSTLDEVLSGLS